MGSVPNVGLMAQKAEEYGSHDKTFIAPGAGTIRVVDGVDGETPARAEGRAGRHLPRRARPRTSPIRDWVKLAVRRARATGAPAVFWLDKNRAHDAQIIAKVETYLQRSRHRRASTSASCRRSTRCSYSLERDPQGPGHDLGHRQRAARLPDRSVPDPRNRHVGQDALDRAAARGRRPVRDRRRRLGAEARAAVPEGGYLRWDSLGEFSALAASLEHIWQRVPQRAGHGAGRHARPGIGKFLDNNKSPARKVGEIDNRGSHFYLALYWAEALAAQTKDAELQARFAPVAKALAENEAKINAELSAAQGKPVDIGGYYQPDLAKTTAAMRPSPTLNAIIDGVASQV